MKKCKLTTADNKFIEKFLKLTEKDFDATKKFMRENRLSGARFEVDCIVAAAIDFIYKLEDAIYSNNLMQLQRISTELKFTNATQNFDRAKMLVLKLNRDAYMGILD